jgi:hypothetical protein
MVGRGAETVGEVHVGLMEVFVVWFEIWEELKEGGFDGAEWR